MAEALAIIVTQAPGARFAAAVELALGWVALGREAGVLLKEAVGALDDAEVARACALLLEGGVRLGACQPSLADMGVAATDLPPGIEPLGLIAFLADRPAAQVVIV